MVVVSDFHLSSSGFEFGCAIGRTFDPHTQFSQIAESQRLESTSGPMDFGFKEGVVKPILEQDPKLKSLGNSALLVDYEIEESFARISRYTYILALSKPMIAPSRSPALVNWMQATGMALLQVNQGKTVQPPLPPDGIRNLQPLERKYELVADVLRDKPIELTRMFTEEKFATAYLRFLKERPELNRAFCTNKKGNMWGFMSNAWPYNERRAYDTCYIYGRGKESPIVFHTTDRVFHGATQD